MDNFVDQLKNNINTDENSPLEGSSKKLFREVLHYISMSPNGSEIKILGDEPCDSYGDIRFEVPMKSLGLSYNTYLEHQKDLCSIFMCNFLGELVVRENIYTFAKIITSISTEDYPFIVEKFNHTKFGMEINRDNFIFIFHISLLQNILLEDFKRKIK